LFSFFEKQKKKHPLNDVFPSEIHPSRMDGFDAGNGHYLIKRGFSETIKAVLQIGKC